jgi:hypothetical protein
VANVNNQNLWLMIFVGCTGAAVLMQAFVLLGMLLTARKALKFMREQSEELRTNVLPLIREQSAKVEASAGAMIERVHRQSTRVDMMLTSALDTVDRAGALVGEVLSVPLRQLSGFAAFARAAIGTLRSGPPPQGEPRPTHAAADKDLFV